MLWGYLTIGCVFGVFFWNAQRQLRASDDPAHRALSRDLDNLPISYELLCLVFVLIWPVLIADMMQRTGRKW